MQKLRMGDEVVVITGKNKGLRGKILKMLQNGTKVLVEGVNLIKKHKKANPQANIEGGIISKEAPIAISNVLLFNPKTQKADRVGFKVLADGKKVRFFKSNGETVEI